MAETLVLHERAAGVDRFGFAPCFLGIIPTMSPTSFRDFINLAACLSAALAFAQSAPDGWAEEPGTWQNLLANPNLANWESLGGDATHQLSGDTLVSESRIGPFHTLFSTKQDYADFILELEVQIDPRLNSGVQIRCDHRDLSQKPLQGYRIDIDPSPKRETGVIWTDTTDRGWKQRYPRAASPKAAGAFHNGGWNHLRIEAIGPSIRVWVNGIMSANLVDPTYQRGFIGLHVHPVKDASLAGLHVNWRNVRIQTTGLQASRWPVDPGAREISHLVNELTEHEKRTGYRLLWDGKSFEGWTDVSTGTISAVDWKIEDGALMVVPEKNEAHTGPPGGIITKQLFGNFELELDFKIGHGANSGVKYFVDPILVAEQRLGMGLEYQLLDDDNSEYATQGTHGNRKLGSAIDLIAPRFLTNPHVTMKKVFGGVDAWNKLRIVSRDGKVEHWLNEEKIVEFDRHSQLFEALVRLSMHSKWPRYGTIPQGHILLQDFDQPAAFRSIKIREF